MKVESLRLFCFACRERSAYLLTSTEEGEGEWLSALSAMVLDTPKGAAMTLVSVVFALSSTIHTVTSYGLLEKVVWELGGRIGEGRRHSHETLCTFVMCLCSFCYVIQNIGYA